MEKTYKEYLEEILCSPVSDQLTGNQKQAVDAMAELLGFCDYEKLCELAKADKENRCVIHKFGIGSIAYGIYLRMSKNKEIKAYIVKRRLASLQECLAAERDAYSYSSREEAEKAAKTELEKMRA